VTAADARRVLSCDPADARARVAEAGAAAREAVAQARAVTVGRRGDTRPEPATAPPGGAVIGARLGWAVLVVVSCGYYVGGLNDAAVDHLGLRLMSLLAAGGVLVLALQIYHSRAVRQGGRPRAWPFTLGLQAVLVYAFFLPPIAMEFSLDCFLAGSVLLLVPGRRRWAGFAAVVASCSVLYAMVPLHGLTASDRSALVALYVAGSIAEIGLLVYGLSRMARMARELEALHEQLTRAAMLRERLRVARDVHDLLGLGLSAIALKTDLIGRLIGRDNARAAAEMEEMSRICAAVCADIRLVTHDGQRLSLAAELTAARQILASAGIAVRASMPGGPLPAAADAVLAPVLREAITNILRHSAATWCSIEAAAGSAVRLVVSNDGVPDRADAGEDGQPGARGGSGLANLTARVQGAGGRLSSCLANGLFELTAEVPLTAPEPGAASGPARVLHPPSPVQGQPAGSQ
jgi:signal transduction histidine kinase